MRPVQKAPVPAWCRRFPPLTASGPPHVPPDVFPVDIHKTGCYNEPGFQLCVYAIGFQFGNRTRQRADINDVSWNISEKQGHACSLLYDINKPDFLADDAVMGVDCRKRETDGIGQPGTVNQDAVPDAAGRAISFALRPLKEMVILFK